MTTPIRMALVPTSRLHDRVKKGLQAVKRDHVTDHLDAKVRSAFKDSLDLDEAFREGHEGEHRWDYLLGHTRSKEIVGLEPHSAREDQIRTVIAKRNAAKDQLRGHLKPSKRVRDWLWVASGTVYFTDTESVRMRLDQNGIKFVGRRVREKDLP
jgi:hypothetical protein